MDLLNILIGFIALINLFLGIGVYWKRKRNLLASSFSLFVYSLVAWCITLMGARATQDPGQAIIWVKLVYVSALFIPTTFFYFTNIFPRFDYRPKKSIKIFVSISLFILLIITLFSDYVITGVGIPPQREKIVYFGSLYSLYFFYIMGYFITAFYQLIKTYRDSKGIVRVQTYYIFLGTLFTTLMGLTTNLFLPTLGYFEFGWVMGPVSTIVMVSFIAYAIVRYRFMDIRLVIGRGAVYIFSFIVVITLGTLLSYLNTKMGTPVPMSLAGPIILVIGISLFPLLFRFYEKFAARYFYYTFYSYQKVLTKLGKKLTGILDLEKLNTLIANTLIDTMKLTKVGILLKEVETETHRIHKIIGFKEENGLALIKDNFLTLFLEKSKKPLIYEELSLAIRETPRKREGEELIKLQENMEKIGAEAYLPLLFEDKIIGIIVLGKKISGEPYSTQDIELLINLSNQSAIAFQNARFYREVEDLSKNLEKRVKEQVKQIEKLSQMKSNFLKVVNHQLRTPVSIVKGMLSMMEEGSVKGKKLKEYIRKAYFSSERLSTILDDILTAQDLVGGEKMLEASPCNIEEIVKIQIKHFKPIAKQKKLKIIFEKSKDIFPLTLANSTMIERIISRVIDNAILYTEKGQIKVSLELKKSKDKRFIQISVKDSGIGLTKKDKKNIFKLFHRGEEATSLHPNGSGLGLFIVKNLVELHKGTIKIKSEGRNKGTTFIIRLPVSTEI